MTVACPYRINSGHHRGRCLVGQRGKSTVEQAHLGVATLTGDRSLLETGHDGDRGVEPGDHVDKGHPNLGGRPIGRAGDVHESAHCLNHQVVAGKRRGRTGAGERLDRQVDERWIRFAELGGPEAAFGHVSRAKILGHHIGGGTHLSGDCQIVLGVEVEGHALLVAIDAEVVGGVAADPRWTPCPGVVT